MIKKNIYIKKEIRGTVLEVGCSPSFTSINLPAHLVLWTRSVVQTDRTW